MNAREAFWTWFDDFKGWLGRCLDGAVGTFLLIVVMVVSCAVGAGVFASIIGKGFWLGAAGGGVGGLSLIGTVLALFWLADWLDD